MNSFSTEAVVLKRKNIGEADKILTLFTARKGKMVVLAKGVRKINSRRSAGVEQLNLIKAYLRESKSRFYLTEVETVDSFVNLKKNLSKISQTYLVLELVDQFLEEEQENKKIFELLLNTLSEIDNCSSVEKTKIYLNNFQIKFLIEVGYLPQLYRCVRCGQDLLPERIFLAPAIGGLIDKECNKQVILSRAISHNATKALRFLEKEPFKLISKLRLEKKLLEEISELLNFYTAFYLERELKSPNFAFDVEKVLSQN